MCRNQTHGDLTWRGGSMRAVHRLGADQFDSGGIKCPQAPILKQARNLAEQCIGCGATFRRRVKTANHKADHRPEA